MWGRTRREARGRVARRLSVAEPRTPGAPRQGPRAPDAAAASRSSSGIHGETAASGRCCSAVRRRRAMRPAAGNRRTRRPTASHTSSFASPCSAAGSAAPIVSRMMGRPAGTSSAPRSVRSIDRKGYAAGSVRGSDELAGAATRPGEPSGLYGRGLNGKRRRSSRCRPGFTVSRASGRFPIALRYISRVPGPSIPLVGLVLLLLPVSTPAIERSPDAAGACGPRSRRCRRTSTKPWCASGIRG